MYAPVCDSWDKTDSKNFPGPPVGTLNFLQALFDTVSMQQFNTA